MLKWKSIRAGSISLRMRVDRSEALLTSWSEFITPFVIVRLLTELRNRFDFRRFNWSPGEINSPNAQ